MSGWWGTPPRAPALDSRHIWKAGRVAAGGCFGNGFIAGLAQFSYKSKNLFAERKQPPLMLAEPPLTIDADYATNDQTGAPDGMGTRAVLVAVSDCGFHGERVAGAWGLARGARVRVGGVEKFPSGANETSNPNFCITFAGMHARRCAVTAETGRPRASTAVGRAFSAIGENHAGGVRPGKVGRYAPYSPNYLDQPSYRAGGRGRNG